MPKQYIISEGGTRGIPIEVEKPQEHNFRGFSYKDEWAFDVTAYTKALNVYNAALEEAKKNAVEIVGAHNWKDGDVVDADKFELRPCKNCHRGNSLIEIDEEMRCETCNDEGYVLIPHTDHRGEESKDWKASIAAAEMKYNLGWEGRMHLFLGFYLPKLLFSQRADIINTIKGTPESREESKDVYKALKDLYEWAYDLLGGANAPESGDSAELKAARKVLKTRNP